MNELIASGVEVGWHAVKRTTSVITTLLVIAGIGWAIYAGIIRPTTKPQETTKQEAENISNVTYELKQTFFGCANFKIPKEKAPKTK